jgi:hypothetical protein
VTFDATAEGRDEAGAAQPAKVQAKAQPAGVVSEDVGFFFRTPSTGLVVILDADEATTTVLDGAVDVDDAMLGQLRTRAEAASAGSFAQAVSRGSQGLLELIFANEDVPRSGKRLVGGETFHEVGSCLHECWLDLFHTIVSREKRTIGCFSTPREAALFVSLFDSPKNFV